MLSIVYILSVMTYQNIRIHLSHRLRHIHRYIHLERLRRQPFQHNLRCPYTSKDIGSKGQESRASSGNLRSQTVEHDPRHVLACKLLSQKLSSWRKSRATKARIQACLWLYYTDRRSSSEHGYLTQMLVSFVFQSEDSEWRKMEVEMLTL